MGTRTRSQIFFSSENRGVGECDFGLGLRMNQHKDSSSSSLLSKKAVMAMAMPPDKTGGYGGAGGGPFCCNQVSCRNDIYDVVGGSVSMAVPTSLQYPLPLNVSGGTMAGAPVRSGVAFTVTQWQELQRQSAIYKYMVASVPVPPELLMPFTKPITPSIPGSPSPRSNKGRGSGEVGLGINKDMEPWRCRRTDGKKWRCTRDVAPDQKYCERHTHKGRHARSRKPVEQLHSDFITKSTTLKPYQKPCSVSGNNQRLCSFPSSAIAASDDQYRCLDWFIKGETVPVSNTNQEWLNMMMQPIPKRDDDPMSLRSYSGFGHNDQTQQTRVFIDAWSETERSEIGRHHKSSVSSNGKLPFSCLTLSVSGGVEENEIPQMGLTGEKLGDLKPNWMTSPVSWVNSPPGGPLGEALCLGIASSSSSTTTSKSSYGDCGQGLNFIN